MNSLFSSILSAASRSLLLTEIPLGLRTSAVTVNFLNPVGDNVEVNTLSDPSVLGVNLIVSISLLLYLFLWILNPIPHLVSSGCVESIKFNEPEDPVGYASANLKWYFNSLSYLFCFICQIACLLFCAVCQELSRMSYLILAFRRLEYALCGVWWLFRDLFIRLAFPTSQQNSSNLKQFGSQI